MNIDLIELLCQFNRKERFFLVGDALGKRDFGLSCDFRKRLQDAIGPDVLDLKEGAIPVDAFAAMDYHLDWIVAALTVFAQGDKEQAFVNEEIDGTKLVIGNQEDVDFLVCFKGQEDIYNLILLEAKAYGGWDYKQMKSKLKRLRRIFGDKGKCIDKVKPTLCFTSRNPPNPGPSANLEIEDWPEWCLSDDGSPYWLELPLPATRLLVTRCDAGGESSRDGQHFCISREGRTN